MALGGSGDTDGEGKGDGVGEGKGSSTPTGLGQTRSLQLSGQNSRIFSNRYVCRSFESPSGCMMGGKVLGVGAQVEFFLRMEI